MELFEFIEFIGLPEFTADQPERRLTSQPIRHKNGGQETRLTSSCKQEAV